MTDKIQTTLRDSAAMRWTALLLLSLAMFCAYIFVDILSPIKELMQEQRGWDSTAFGTMQGSETFLNVFRVLPYLCRYHPRQDGRSFHCYSLWCSDVTGALIKYYAISDSFAGSGLEVWFTNNLNHIPVFEQLGCVAFLSGHACVSQGSRLWLHDIWLWNRDGRYHSFSWYC